MSSEYNDNIIIKNEPHRAVVGSAASGGDFQSQPLELVNKHPSTFQFTNIKQEYLSDGGNEQFKRFTEIKQESPDSDNDKIMCSEGNFSSSSENLSESIKDSDNNDFSSIMSSSLPASGFNVGSISGVSIANLTGKKLYDFPKKDLKKRRYSKETKNENKKAAARKERQMYPCDLCSHVSKKRSDLKSHKLSHSEETPHVCEECGDAFRTLSSLLSHVKTHTGLKAFRCDQCDYSSNFTNSIKTHKIMHSGEKPLACSECSYTCGRTSNLNRHMLRHSLVRTFPCDMCSYVSKDITILKVHKLVHTGMKPHVCNVCNRSYVTVKSLNHHKKKHFKSNIGLM